MSSIDHVNVSFRASINLLQIVQRQKHGDVPTPESPPVGKGCPLLKTTSSFCRLAELGLSVIESCLFMLYKGHTSMLM